MNERKMIGFLVVLNLTTIGVVFLGAAAPEAKPKVIEAQQFILVDEKGKMRADLVLAQGHPRLSFYDENKKPLAAIRTTEFGGQLMLQTNGEISHSILLSASKNGAHLSISDSPDCPRIMISNMECEPTFAIFDKDKQYRVGFGMNEGKTIFVLRNGKGEAFFTQP